MLLFTAPDSRTGRQGATVDDRERDLGKTTAGVWTAAAARAAGLSPDQVRGRLRSGAWQALRRGTYADGGVTPDALMRASSAVQSAALRGRRAVAAGRTAARIYGWPLVDDDDPATSRSEAAYDDLAVTTGRSLGATLGARRLALAIHDVSVVRGVPVLTRLRTIADLAVLLRPDALVCVLDHALRAEDVTPSTLADLAAKRFWCPGAPALREAVDLADPRAESPHETLTRLLLVPALPGLVPQVPVYDDHGWLIARLDLGDRALRLGVESDGAAFHRGRAAQDRRRDARTGWTIERCTWFETRREPAQLRARVLGTATRLAGRGGITPPAS